MTDFDERLTRALVEGAKAAPSADRLVTGALARIRARRRSRLGVAAVGVALAIAVPLGTATLLGRDRDVADPAPTTRTESWHDLEIEVPVEWKTGSRSTWCARGRGSEPAPVVERPGMAVLHILCASPQTSYGVSFLESDLLDPALPTGQVTQYVWSGGDGTKLYPNGSWVGLRVLGGVAVQVAARDQAVARQILDSASSIVGADSNGCAPRVTWPTRSDEPELPATPAGPAGDVAICHYGEDDESGLWLQQSERLTRADADAARAPLSGLVPAVDESVCTEQWEARNFALLTAPGVVARVTYESFCPHRNGVFVAGQPRQALTPELMYWVLPPGWTGGVDGSVPLPEELRE